ncbi:MAG: DUF1330 domain-containing protein [Rhodospirillales bacterium]|nr:DUF1330 domain-containing protein [Rhodospirillales bacterium]
MAAYLVGQIEIHDSAEYTKYLDGLFPLLSQFDMEVLVADDNAQVVEGKWKTCRTVVIKFPSHEELRRWYDSPEYQAIIQHRFNSTTSNIIAADGFVMPAA